MSRPPYIPAARLVSSTHLTETELVSQYKVFSNLVRHISEDPEVVFGCLVLNICMVVNESRRVDLENCMRDIKMHQLVINQFVTEIEKLGGNVSVPDFLADVVEAAVNPPTTVVEGAVNTPTAVVKAAVNPPTAVIKAAVNPPTAVVKAVVKKNPTIGTFHTNELRSSEKARIRTSKLVHFAHAYPVAPKLVVGLTAVDVDRHANVRVNSYATRIQGNQFEIHLDSWEKTQLYAAGCAWLELEANDPDFQFGSYNTREDHPWTKPQIHNARKIFFKNVYPAAPRVVVWLRSIDLGSGKNWRIRAFATDVTATGFTIHIDTWADSVLHTAVACWLAYPAHRTGVASGNINTPDMRLWAQPQLQNSGHETFTGALDKSPKVFLALNALDMDHGHNMRLAVTAENVSAIGMTWHLDSCQDSILYSAGASYIALS